MDEEQEQSESFDQQSQSQSSGQQSGPISPGSLIGKAQTIEGIGKSLVKAGSKKVAEKAAQSAAVGAGRAAAAAGAEAAASGVAAATSEVWAPVAIAIILGIILIILIFGTIAIIFSRASLFSSSGAGATTPTPTTSSGGTSSFAACTYYHQGEAMTLGNSEVAAFIQAVATKTDVPAVVVAGVLRIEMGYFFGSTRADYFTNDYFDDARAYRGPAFGVMQIKPSTFELVFTNHKSEISSLFNKTSFDSAISSYSYSPTDSVFRIVSIRDSIIAGAYYIKEMKNAAVGSTAPWNEEAIRGVARGYQGGCDYGYCDNLWKSVRECEFSSTTAETAPVEQLVDLVNSGSDDNCSRGVTQGNFLICASKFSSIDPENRAKNAMVGFMRRNPSSSFQCVGLAETAAALQQYPAWVNKPAAHNYITPPSGYQFIRKGEAGIKPGDIPIWWSGYEDDSGHIAFVLKILPDGQFNIAEANFGAPGRIRHDRNMSPTTDLKGWLRKL